MIIVRFCRVHQWNAWLSVQPARCDGAALNRDVLFALYRVSAQFFIHPRSIRTGISLERVYLSVAAGGSSTIHVQTAIAFTLPLLFFTTVIFMTNSICARSWKRAM